MSGTPRWHALAPADVIARLETHLTGLPEAEAGRRRARVGPNVFERTPPRPAWRILVDQFTSIVVLLLVGAMVVALLTRDVPETIAIGAVLVLNAGIGFVTELRARRAMEALLGLEVSQARVIRDGRARDIDARELVPGDVIELEEGQTVPADARLLESAELRVIEAPLTGESVPVTKQAMDPVPADAAVPDRTTLVFKSTLVATGHARAVVVTTGMQTEVGRIGRLAGGIEERETPLERRIDSLGRRLVVVAVVVAGLVGGLGLLQDAPLALVLETAIALAVAAVPEGLPAVVTVAMAVGVRRMARRRAFIRRLSAVETLGSATVICTDKTGTLTAGEMTVAVLWIDGREIQVTGAGYDPSGELRVDGRPADPTSEPMAAALRVSALCNRADVRPDDAGWAVHGDPTDAALLVAARKAGFDRQALRERLPEIAQIPFSSERRFMATFHRDDGGDTLALVKGAPGEIVSRSGTQLTADGRRALAPPDRDALLAVNQDLAARGLRVIALAQARVTEARPEALRDLVLLGFAGLIDPPADGVLDTIGTFRNAGIRTVMITGDQRLTALAIGRDLGVLGPEETALEGAELDRMSDEELVRRMATVSVVSRSSPEGKLRVIDALQQRGESVAMLGDGVNDAAALRKADIGVAMGIRGTDVAKEAADVILADDRFRTISAAIEEGRVIFTNIRKFVFYLFSCNVAEILVFLGAALAGLPPPLLPLQILWLNLVTDTLPALALAVEPGDPDVMRQPPRSPSEHLFPRSLVRETVVFAGLITAVTLAGYWWMLDRPGGGRDEAATVAFLTLAFAQIFHLGNARSDRPVWSPRRAASNPWALAALLGSVALQVLAVEVEPLARVLELAPLAAEEWAVVVALGVVPAVLGQIAKALRPAAPA